MLFKHIVIRGRLLRFHEHARYMTHLTQSVYSTKNSGLFTTLTPPIKTATNVLQSSGKCSKKRPKQQQTLGKFPQMFHKTAKTATFAGVFPANVPKNHQNSNKCRENSRKCSTKRPKQQHLPEFFPQMFQKTTKTATNAGKIPANVPKNHQNNNICRRKNSRKCS